MVATILGTVLLAVPFLLSGLFKDNKKGFVYVLFFLMLFHTILAVLTQLFGIFYYAVIFTATLLADAAAIIYWVKKGRGLQKKESTGYCWPLFSSPFRRFTKHIITTPEK